jgi:hypothetical protein
MEGIKTASRLEGETHALSERLRTQTHSSRRSSAHGSFSAGRSAPRTVGAREAGSSRESQSLYGSRGAEELLSTIISRGGEELGDSAAELHFAPRRPSEFALTNGSPVGARSSPLGPSVHELPSPSSRQLRASNSDDGNDATAAQSDPRRTAHRSDPAAVSSLLRDIDSVSRPAHRSPRTAELRSPTPKA